MMKVLFLTKYHYEGPSSRYRSYNYQKFLEKNEIECTYKPLFFDGYVKKLYKKEKISKIEIFKAYWNRIIFILKNKKKYDHIIIEKELFPYIPYWLEAFLLSSTSYSLDFDDNPKAKYKSKKILRIFFSNKIDKLAKNAKFVVVGNKWYFEDYEYNQNFVYIPTVVDLEKYDLNLQKKNQDSISIVWIGSPSNNDNLLLLKSVFKKIVEKYPNVYINIIGTDILENEKNINTLPWSEENEVKYLMNSDIGVMPLKSGYWEKGKCGFKLIQYMACELPVVASAVSANKEIIEQEINGYLVEEEKDWFEFFEKLILNEKLRKELGKNGRKKIEEFYSYQSVYEKFIKLIKEK